MPSSSPHLHPPPHPDRPITPTKHPPNPPPSSKLLQFIRSELLPPTSSSPHPDHIPDDEDTASYYRRREKVYTFIQIPTELEKLMGYGFFQCADAFLYVFTFLPLRCALALQAYVSGWVNNAPVCLKPSDKCEMLKVLILVLCSVLFTYIDTNVLYHVIKSQSVIKLYIFFNMLEVGDRLFSSFSQDSLDALFITATENQYTPTPSTPPSSPAANTSTSRTKSIKKLSTTTHALICGVSILGHALVILLQSTTLSVAINANNRALLTVMMSNNFVELKGSVFKKFDKMNLFQVSCSDIRERFHLFVLLLIVCLQTLREYSWEESRFWVLLPDCLMVMIAEIVVDWLKHAFITRFNELPLNVYEHYTRSLAYDMAESLKRKSNRVGFGSDYSDVVGRRLGFVPLPLAIVLVRVVTPMWKLNDRVIGIVMLSVVGYVGLASFRILNMIVLVGKAVRIIDEHHAVSQGGEVEGERRNSVSVSQGVGDGVAKNSILKRSRTISGSDGDLLSAMKKEEKKLTFQDDLKDDGEGIGRVHLFANSNVSLVSCGFNEEMMKVEKGVVEGGGGFVGERKHSLGVELEAVCFGMRDGGVKCEVEVEEDEDRGVFFGELDRTVVEVVGGDRGGGDGGDIVKVEEREVEVKSIVKDEVKEEVVTELSQPVATVTHNPLESSSEETKQSKSKKLMNWFK